MKRHFIVFYTGVSESGRTIIGNATMESEGFLNHKAAQIHIFSIDDNDLKSVVITNFIEVNYEEMQAWISVE